MSENNFNKFKAKGHGTLIGNWQEEQHLQDFTGTGRTIPKEHIPKKWGNLEEPIQHGKQFDSTMDRIHGQRREELMNTYNHNYGRSTNPADSIKHTGSRTEKIEAAIMEQVRQEQREKEEREEKIRNMRYFDSTTKTTFVEQDMSQNTLGSRVMMTQDGKGLPKTCQDEQLKVEHGFGVRTTKESDTQLYQKIPGGDYTKAQPVTIYTEAIKSKHVPISAATGANPFAKSSGFTQPVQQSKAVKKFEGNVDFESEERGTQFRNTASTLIMNPQKESENFDELREKIIKFAQERSGNGIRGIRMMFKAMDRDGSHGLDPVEFKYAMRDYGIPITDKESAAIAKNFDTNRDGKISFDEFLRKIRGDLNDRRTDLVHLAYKVLDRTGEGLVTIDDVMLIYDASFHPDFVSGKKGKEQVLREFMTIWETHKHDGIVTLEEFEDYYKDVSASIDSDDYFEVMIRKAWKMDEEKEGNAYVEC